MNVTIVNGYDDHGCVMAIYAAGNLVATTKINGGNEAPDNLLDFLHEFGLVPSSVGVSDVAELESESFDAIEWCRSDVESITDDEYNALQAEGTITENGYYVYPEMLSDLLRLKG